MLKKKREWMGIEPTWPLFRGHTGFEARGSHQICIHPHVANDCAIVTGSVASVDSTADP